MKSCIINELENGEFNGIDIFEITEIPDISILINNLSDEKNYILKHKKQFETLVVKLILIQNMKIKIIHCQ